MRLRTRPPLPTYLLTPFGGKNSQYLGDGLTTLNIQMHISWGVEK